MSPVPKLQLALDTPDLQHALAVMQQTSEHIDIIEVGTLLILSEGLGALRTMRESYPDHTIVADVRIVRAGGKIARMVFDAGADWVTVVAEAPASTLVAVCKVVNENGYGEVLIELGETLDIDQIGHWQELGIQRVIYHSESELTENGQTYWPDESLQVVRQLGQRGFHVTAAGGIKPESISMFAGIPLSVIIAGRTIWNSKTPRKSARAIREAITHTYG